MAYRIEYAKNTKYQPPASLCWDRLGRIAMVFFLIFLLATAVFWPDGRLMLQRMILPCDMDVTTDAFCSMLEDIRDGESLEVAVEAFCKEIITGAALTD